LFSPSKRPSFQDIGLFFRKFLHSLLVPESPQIEKKKKQRVQSMTIEKKLKKDKEDEKRNRYLMILLLGFTSFIDFIYKNIVSYYIYFYTKLHNLVNKLPN